MAILTVALYLSGGLCAASDYKTESEVSDVNLRKEEKTFNNDRTS